MQRKHGAAFVVRVTLCSLVVHPPPPLHRLLIGVFFLGVSGWFLSHFTGLLRLTGCQVPPLEVGALVVSGVAMSH